MGEPVPDEELLRRHLAGQPDCFAELVRRHRDRLWAVALRTLGEPEEAADALQDALLAAYRGAASFRGEAQVTTWLHRIVVNACLDRVRRRRARPTVAMPAEESLPPSPTDPLGDRELSLDLIAGLRDLPAEQAAAIVLVDVEGRPVAEVARILGVAEGTVKSRCARGRARLAVRLAHLDPRNRPVTGRVGVGDDAGEGEP